jgi:hypothetical protein
MDKDEQPHTESLVADSNGKLLQNSPGDSQRLAATTINPKELFAIQTSNIHDPYSNPPTAIAPVQPYDWSRNLIHLAKTSELK